MNSTRPFQVDAERTVYEFAPRPIVRPHILLADPDLARASKIAAGLQEHGWECEIAGGMWEALGKLDALRFTHLIAQLHQIGPDDLGGMLLAWTWLRTGRSAPMVLGTAPEIADDPSVHERRIVLAPESSTATDIWNQLEPTLRQLQEP